MNIIFHNLKFTTTNYIKKFYIINQIWKNYNKVIVIKVFKN